MCVMMRRIYPVVVYHNDRIAQPITSNCQAGSRSYVLVQGRVVSFDGCAVRS